MIARLYSYRRGKVDLPSASLILREWLKVLTYRAYDREARSSVGIPRKSNSMRFPTMMALNKIG